MLEAGTRKDVKQDEENRSGRQVPVHRDPCYCGSDCHCDYDLMLINDCEVIPCSA